MLVTPGAQSNWQTSSWYEERDMERGRESLVQSVEKREKRTYTLLLVITPSILIGFLVSLNVVTMERSAHNGKYSFWESAHLCGGFKKSYKTLSSIYLFFLTLPNDAITLLQIDSDME